MYRKKKKINGVQLLFIPFMNLEYFTFVLLVEPNLFIFSENINNIRKNNLL